MEKIFKIGCASIVAKSHNVFWFVEKEYNTCICDDEHRPCQYCGKRRRVMSVRFFPLPRNRERENLVYHIEIIFEGGESYWTGMTVSMFGTLNKILKRYSFPKVSIPKRKQRILLNVASGKIDNNFH